MSNTMTGREVLRAIADGASIYEFEYRRHSDSEWQPPRHDWYAEELGKCLGEFRRKSRTINIRGFDVPAPEPADRLIPNGGVYFVPIPSTSLWMGDRLWCNDSVDNRMLKRGLVYLNQDDAVRVAKAMCGVDPDAEE